VKPPTIADGFASYRSHVIPSSASAVQVSECRLAYYAGAMMLLSTVAAIGDGDIDDADGVAILEALQQESERFAAAQVAIANAEQAFAAVAAAAAADQGAGFNVRNPDLEQVLRELGHDIRGRLPDGFGFTLLLFSLGAGGSLFYLSSADRDDMIRAMREFIGRNTQ